MPCFRLSMHLPQPTQSTQHSQRVLFCWQICAIISGQENCRKQPKLQLRHKGENYGNQKNSKGGMPTAVVGGGYRANRGVVVFAPLLAQQEKNRHKQQ